MTTPATDHTDYSRHRARMADVSRERSASGREIGPLPKVKNPKRRKACQRDFKRFCETYFPERFDKPWGRDHLEVLKILQDVILSGGLFPLAMPRGSGKTTLATCAVLFAVLYGHRRYVVFIASNSKVANDRLDELIRSEIELNPLLLEDFPEVCFPVVRLENNPVRARMQTLGGLFTGIEWGAGALKLPTVPGSAASAARIACAGLASGDIRGLLVRAPDGSLDRPDLVICDDPQSDESARMPGQCDTREQLVTGAIMGLAGPGKSLAIVVPCTVIRPNDLSDRLLDRKRNPEWYGRKFRLVDQMPTDLDLWQRYGSLLREGLEEDPPSRAEANEFYAANRAAMDAGADLPWPDRDTGKDGTSSAIQFAMNLYLLKPAMFAAEYQNEPLDFADSGGATPIEPCMVTAKVNQTPRGTVPEESSRLVAFFDPNFEIICWTVVGLSEQFAPAVVDYGTFPRQHGAHFSATDPGNPMSAAFRDQSLGLEARVYAGLTAAAGEVLGRAYQRAGGGELRVELCLVDAGLGQLSDTIHQWCRQTPHKDIVKASRGRYVGAAKVPMSHWKPGPGDRKGPGWWFKAAGVKHGREVLFDANMWKSFLAERVRSPMGTPGALTVFGSSPAAHQLFADHLGAEFPTRVSADGRTVDEWQKRVGRPDNDYLDCMAGCLVAGSVLGLRFSATGQPEPPKPAAPPLSYASARRAPQAPTGGGAKPLTYAEMKPKGGVR